MGSEMCIRDRVQVAAHRGAPVLDADDAVVGIEQLHVAADQQEHCLLYTSDAADERSSVDLGGRRIIKKKNKREYM